MNVVSWLLWGFVSTLVLTSLLAISQGLGLTRMNIPYLLGTMFTPNRDRAKIVGVVFHLINGWIFSLLYVWGFEVLGHHSWWIGSLFGLLHAVFVLTVALPILPGMHPRMASEVQGPTVVKQLEPPGFLGLHYGFQTPLSIVIAHMIYGAILGAFYV
jgi:uncharacterized membrane protein YagU involved in acid resistance